MLLSELVARSPRAAAPSGNYVGGETWSCGWKGTYLAGIEAQNAAKFDAPAPPAPIRLPAHRVGDMEFLDTTSDEYLALKGVKRPLAALFEGDAAEPAADSDDEGNLDNLGNLAPVAVAAATDKGDEGKEGRFWMITLHEDTVPDVRTAMDLMAAKATKHGHVLVGQLEVCPKSGKPHGQLYLEAAGNWKWARLRKEYGPYYYARRKGSQAVRLKLGSVHLEHPLTLFTPTHTVAPHLQDAIKYVSKSDSRATGGDAHSVKVGAFKETKQGKRTDLEDLAAFVREKLEADVPSHAVLRMVAARYPGELVKFSGGVEKLLLLYKPIPKYDVSFDFDVMYRWQRQVAEMVLVDPRAPDGAAAIKTPESRPIFFLYDKVGNAGKSALLAWIANKTGSDKMIELSGEVKDAAFAYVQQSPPIAAYDIPRADGAEKSWSAKMQLLEALSNGRVMNQKYVAGLHIFKRPWLFVVCNSLPRKLSSMLSVDRVRIWPVAKPSASPAVISACLSFADKDELDRYVAGEETEVGGMNF